MTKAIAQTYTFTHEYMAQITTMLMIAIAAMAFFYAFNVYSLISHTVALGRTESRVTAESSAVSDLDAQYLQLSSSITPDIISQYGLQAPDVTAYIPRLAPTASLDVPAAGGNEL